MLQDVGPHLLDAFGRHLEYLRLSVTERCNFRCSYCLPRGCPVGSGLAPLSVGEIDRLVAGFAELGFWKVRITGGEPTLRKDLLEIVERVAARPGVRQVGLTTNGYLLEALARDLGRAGLSSLNVSIDSLDPERFAAITGCSRLDRILAGLEAVLAAGIPRVKMNVVLLAGTAATEIDRFLSLPRQLPLTVRFIELMETCGDPGYFARNHLSAGRLERLLAERGWIPLARAEGDGPAVEYGQAGSRGRVGIISPYRNGFCRSCNRLRVSAAGDLRLCLFDDRAVPLRPLLQSDDQCGELGQAIRRAVLSKPEAHHLEESPRRVQSLASIGG
jgi:cyclic pyranopterin phosphate synthase